MAQTEDRGAPVKIIKDQPGPLGRPAEATREYVAGGQFGWHSYQLRSLPAWIDDTTRDFGDDLYERMMLDPQVQKCVNIVKLAALSQGIHLQPAVPEEDPRHAKAVEINDFCRRNLDGLQQAFSPETATPLYWQLWDLLDGIALGHKVAEQVYVIATAGPDKGRLVLQDIKPKPRKSTGFVVNPYMGVIGILGVIPGVSPSVNVGSLVSEKAPNILPRRKFVVMSFRPKDSDPRGRSILRSAYNAWWIKAQGWPEYMAYLAQFATPSLIGYTAPNAQETVQYETDGITPVLDEDSLPTVVRPEQAMLDALIQLRGCSAAVFPNGAKVDPLTVGSSTTSEFDTFFRLCNNEIANAILGQTLATEEAKFQARASSETHQDTLGLLVEHVKNALGSMVRGDVLRNLVEWNFGADCLDLIPLVAMSATEQQDFSKNASAIASLVTCGYLHPSQYRKLDAFLSLPDRSEESIEEAIAKASAGARQAEAAAETAENPPEPGALAPATKPQSKAKQKGDKNV